MNTFLTRFVPAVICSAVLAATAMGCQRETKGATTVITAAAAGTLDRDAPIAAKNHREVAFYSARTQGESETKIFLRGHAGEAPRLVYVDAEPGELVSVSDDGTHGVFRRYIAPGQTTDITIDLQKSES
ncbi:hypothetical protein LVJ94_50605 [Pendulispora rubella]|uniref:Uncharacterized protein n=1 Tax=Pendulispora rubella TaxID=2741070 RepID=A0ABZ2L2W9_9BACT